MAEHVIKLTDDQELGLQWRVRLEGATADDILARWVTAGASEAAADLAAAWTRSRASQGACTTIYGGGCWAYRIQRWKR